MVALGAASLLAGIAQAEAAQWRVAADTWLRPRSGEAVVGMAPVAEAVRAWQRQPAGKLIIRYPGGEEGGLWAAELRDWLIALGVPSHHIRTVPGGEPGGLGLDVAESSSGDE